MSSPRNLPPPPLLDRAPQLAILEVLESALDVTAQVLAAENPKLLDHELPYWVAQKEPPSYFTALAIIKLLQQLRRSIDRYRADVDRELNDRPMSR